MCSWYDEGYSGREREEQRLAASGGPNRFWMRAKEERLLVAIDIASPFAIHEHNLKASGSWRNHHTCTRGVDEYEGIRYDFTCQTCRRVGEKTRYYIAYFTGVDCSKSVDKKGNVYQYEVKLVGVKIGMMAKLERYCKEMKEEGREPAGSKWKIRREDDKKPATGDEWRPAGVIEDQEKLFELANYRGKSLSELWDRAASNPEAYVQLARVFQLPPVTQGLPKRVMPFSYFHVLGPKPPNFIDELLGSADKGSGRGQDANDDSSGDALEDEVPF